MLTRLRELEIKMLEKKSFLEFTKRISFSLGFASLVGLSTHLKIFLPWSPVPITAQTFFVLLGGILLGKFWGGIAELIYVGLGSIGLQWFAGGNILGPTGGYLIGFVLAGFFLGYVVEVYKPKGLLNIFFLMLLANFFLIYIPGILYLGFYLSTIKGSFPGIYQLLLMGLFPFIPGDLIKISFASIIASVFIKRKNFSNKT
ncbi:MAG: biotin transporter BioY [candidate division WOR-3 bacterium]